MRNESKLMRPRKVSATVWSITSLVLLTFDRAIHVQHTYEYGLMHRVDSCTRTAVRVPAAHETYYNIHVADFVQQSIYGYNIVVALAQTRAGGHLQLCQLVYAGVIRGQYRRVRAHNTQHPSVQTDSPGVAWHRQHAVMQQSALQYSHQYDSCLRTAERTH